MNDDFARVLKALGDETRRDILDLLHTRPMTTGDVAAGFEMSRIAIMKHLKVLSEASLVISEKRGRERWHHLNIVPLREVYERWLDPERGRWAEALVGLKRRVEGRETMAQRGAGESGLAIDIAEEVTITAAPAAVFSAIVDDPGAWWGQPFVDSQAKKLELEGHVGGGFIERWKNGGGALLANVTRIEPGQRLELTGRLHFGALYGVVDFVLTPSASSTVLRFSHKAIGDIDPSLAGQVSGAWRDLLGFRLKAFVETGKRLGLER